MTAGGDIPSLVPHRGSMCLLERVLEWDVDGLTAATRTHSAPWNPLRRAGRLRAIHLCEYGAQAMAVHGGLCARAAGTSIAPGLLVSIRDLLLSADTVHGLEGELQIEVKRLARGSAGLQYEFRVTHCGSELARGRAAVVERAGAP